MQTFPTVVYKDQESDYCTGVSDLQSCHSAGSTVSEPPDQTREAATKGALSADERLQALDDLQHRLALVETSAADWAEEILDERPASTERRLG